MPHPPPTPASAAGASAGGAASVGSRISSGCKECLALQQQREVLQDQRHKGESVFSIRLQSEANKSSKVTWRLRERMKTANVGLLMCLNIGTDPPDVVKTSPCARKECWIDPQATSRSKARETIGRALQEQYEKLQPRARYRLCLDPTADDFKKLCHVLRRGARGDRVLFHYNGHGVPRPTANGELWVFNKTYTQYIPLSVYDIKQWAGTPSIYVLDCSSAGILLPHFLSNGESPAAVGAEAPPATAPGSGAPMSSPVEGEDVESKVQRQMQECIVLAPCMAGELLPMNPEFPADTFTSCLTTPIPIALRWFIFQNKLSMADVDPSWVDEIPGKLGDRKTPLGELNWIFTAITDTIAWTTLPSALFQRLFRQDLLVASLFRNFLLADRILRGLGCSPVSYPRLPPTSEHHLWQAWDLAAEQCLAQLHDGRGSFRRNFPESVPAPPRDPVVKPNDGFFREQLTAFEVWLDFGGRNLLLCVPPQLPIVLQVLLSQAHRLRALILLKKFLDLGPAAVNLALSVGIFPYVLKLLQAPTSELRQVLVGIWARILAFDPSCQGDLVKDNAHLYFISHLSDLNVGVNINPKMNAQQKGQSVMAALSLAILMRDNRLGQAACLEEGLHRLCVSLLDAHELQSSPKTLLLCQWLCLDIASLCWGYADAQAAAVRDGVPHCLFKSFERRKGGSNFPEVRCAAAYALASLLSEDSASAATAEEEDEDEEEEEEDEDGQRSCSRTNGRGATDEDDDDDDEAALMSVSRNSLFGRQADDAAEAKRLVDLQIALGLAAHCTDASPIVRREVALALGVLVSTRLHFPNFVLAAKEGTGDSEEQPATAEELATKEADMMSKPSGSSTSQPGDPLPTDAEELGSPSVQQQYLALWASIRSMQKEDAFPAVAEAATAVVQTVNEAVAMETTLPMDVKNTPNLPPRFRIVSEGNSPGGPLNGLSNSVPSNQTAGSSKASNVLPAAPPELRRCQTEVASRLGGASHALSPNLNRLAKPHLLHSFYRWSCEQFNSTSAKELEKEAATLHIHNRSSKAIDPLSEDGAYSLYFAQRNKKVLAQAEALAAAHRPLLPGMGGGVHAPSASVALGSVAGLERVAGSITAPPPQMEQSAILDSGAPTSLLTFHPFEPLLVVADDSDGITVWNFEDGRCRGAFANFNPLGSRMTALEWLNPASRSLLLVGSDDGMVRIWGGLLECQSPGGEPFFEDKGGFTTVNGAGGGDPADSGSVESTRYSVARAGPGHGGGTGGHGSGRRLITAFNAVPDILKGQRGSGLVSLWQQKSGTLFCGGNSPRLRAWDLHREQCCLEWPAYTESCVTVVASPDGSTSGVSQSAKSAGAPCPSPSTIVAGCGDGSIHLFDIREGGRPVRVLREHSSWIVNVHFTRSMGGNEMLSASAAGDMRFWDIRMSQSLSALSIQRNPMTALVVHERLPIIASGSHNQFVKVLTIDGETISVIRYHDGFLGQRIGPISALAFHPNRLVLAAGATDSIVSVYA
jgi:WD40 repeat protein